MKGMPKKDTSAKGISPVIATVLLIAFTVAVAGLVSAWLTGFTRTSTGIVQTESETELYCVYAGISVSSLNYCSSQSNLTGIIANTRLVDLGNITLQIIYTNVSTHTIYLSQNGSERTGSSSMALQPGKRATFDVNVDSSYDKIFVYTNCSKVSDDATSSDVTTSC